MLNAPVSRRKFLALSALASMGSTLRAAEARTNIAAGNTEFAADLFGQLRSEAGNVFYSPFSISTALAMTGAGAKGETLAEFQKVLHLPADLGAANAQFGELLAKINPQGKVKLPYQLSTANAVWAQKGYPWRREYVTVVNTLFAAAVEDVDYGMPDAARKRINDWVEKETKEKIKDLIPQGALTPLTRLVLTNAIYFKGTWLSQFTKDSTQDQPFKLGGGKTSTVPLMYQEKFYRYGEAPGLQVLELPYKGNDLSMVVLLPKDVEGLVKVEADVTAENVGKWTKDLRSQKVRVFLPRFKVETSYKLNAPLQALGLKRAFSESEADFGGMHTGMEKPFISLVVHKAFVDVNEEGTEAAAATGVIVGVTSARPVVEEPKVFRADHPFLFFIRHNPTGSVLFMGRVTNPKG